MGGEYLFFWEDESFWRWERGFETDISHTHSLDSRMISPDRPIQTLSSRSSSSILPIPSREDDQTSPPSTCAIPLKEEEEVSGGTAKIEVLGIARDGEGGIQIPTVKDKGKQVQEFATPLKSIQPTTSDPTLPSEDKDYHPPGLEQTEEWSDNELGKSRWSEGTSLGDSPHEDEGVDGDGEEVEEDDPEMAIERSTFGIPNSVIPTSNSGSMKASTITPKSSIGSEISLRNQNTPTPSSGLGYLRRSWVDQRIGDLNGSTSRYTFPDVGKTQKINVKLEEPEFIHGLLLHRTETEEGFNISEPNSIPLPESPGISDIPNTAPILQLASNDPDNRLSRSQSLGFIEHHFTTPNHLHDPSSSTSHRPSGTPLPLPVPPPAYRDIRRVSLGLSETFGNWRGSALNRVVGETSSEVEVEADVGRAGLRGRRGIGVRRRSGSWRRASMGGRSRGRSE